MNFTEYTSIKNKFNSTPNLCDLFKLLSIETWKRIEYAYLKPHVKVFETTITQNLIFSINAYKDQYGLDIEISEALSERTNGNDLELVIKFPAHNIEYYVPIQAKKVYRNGKYISMDHGNQIESLISYGGTKSKPLYLLYNFTTYPLMPGKRFSTPLELTGCTLISAQYLFDNYYKKRTGFKDGVTIEKWKTPDFYDLNPSIAFPWHELVCPQSPEGLMELLLKKNIVSLLGSEKSLIRLINPRATGFLPIGTTDSDKWVRLDIFKSSDVIRDESFQSYELSTDSERNSERVWPDFSPRSKITIIHNKAQ